MAVGQTGDGVGAEGRAGAGKRAGGRRGRVEGPGRTGAGRPSPPVPGPVQPELWRELEPPEGPFPGGLCRDAKLKAGLRNVCPGERPRWPASITIPKAITAGVGRAGVNEIPHQKH